MPAVADTQGAVDEKLQLHAHRFPDRPDLIQRELSLKHQPGSPEGLIEPRLLRSLDSALGRGVDRKAVAESGAKELENGEILGDDGVHPRVPGLLQKPFGGRKLRVVKYRVESQEYPRPELVGIFAKPPDVLHRVPGVLPRPELRPRDIYRIGTAVDGRDADVSVSRRGEKFKFSHYFPPRAAICCLAWAPSLGSF